MHKKTAPKGGSSRESQTGKTGRVAADVIMVFIIIIIIAVEGRSGKRPQVIGVYFLTTTNLRFEGTGKEENMPIFGCPLLLCGCFSSKLW
jgi:hypothetical protein